jgi:hypothetical protein
VFRRARASDPVAHRPCDWAVEEMTAALGDAAQHILKEARAHL